MFGIFVSVQFSCSDKWNKIFANRCNGFMKAISGTNSDICAVETEFNSSIFSINNTYLQVAIKQKDNLIGIKAEKHSMPLKFCGWLWLSSDDGTKINEM